MAKLTKAQKRELEFLYRNGKRTYGSFDKSPEMRVYEKLSELGHAKRELSAKPRAGSGYDTIYTLTDSGLQLARELFGSNEPDPSDASEPDDVLIDEPVPYKPLDSFKVKARIGEVRDYTGTQDTASAYPAPLSVAEKREIVASSEPKTGVQWLNIRDLKRPKQVYWNQQAVDWIAWLYASNQHTPQSSLKARSAISTGFQVRRQPNMAYGGLKAFTPQSQTPKRVSRKRKQWLRELAKQRNLNPNIHVLEALGAKPDVKVEAA